MPFSSGTFTFTSNSFAPSPTTGTTISSTAATATWSDLATALSTCVLKDGSQTITANIPMNSFKFTGLAAGSTSGDSVRYEQVLLLAGGTMTGVLAVPDTDLHITGSSDATKIFRFEVDGFTAGQTRTLTPPNADLTLAAVTAKGDILAASASGVLTNVAVSSDGKPLVGASAQTAGVAFGNAIVLGTEQATTSGASIDFTNIPSGVRRITIMLNEVSTNGTSAMVVQIGDSGGVEATGYISGVQSGATYASTTVGFVIVITNVAAATYSGAVTLTLEDSTDFTWVQSSNINRNADSVHTGAGRKATSAELDRVRLTTVGGTDAFDSGVVNICYEF